MLSDLDLWRAANVMIKRYRDGAATEAAMRADEFLDQGIIDGQRLPGPAHASLVWDFEIVDAFNLGFSGSRTIAFGVSSGSLALGDPVTFSFAGNTLGAEWTAGTGDLFIVDWSIDSTWGILVIDLVTSFVQTDSAGFTANLAFFVTSQDGDAESDLFSGGNFFGEGIGSISLTPVHAGIPEPSTLAIFLVGLAGLGFVARRHRTDVVTTRRAS